MVATGVAAVLRGETVTMSDRFSTDATVSLDVIGVRDAEEQFDEDVVDGEEGDITSFAEKHFERDRLASTPPLVTGERARSFASLAFSISD